MKTHFKVGIELSGPLEVELLSLRRQSFCSPSGRKEIARRFNGGIPMQIEPSPAGTAEK
jgi:hypothetical protein